MMFDLSLVSAFLQVAMIDLVLAGDNALVIGLAAAGLPADQRKKAILIGILAATCLRIALALLAARLLGIVGLVLAGGFLLLWVCWKMWRELRSPPADGADAGEGAAEEATASGGKTLGQAVTQIVVADVSMSVDNVLAVAGAAREHTTALVLGLMLSVGLMGVASAFVSRLLGRYRWIAYLGLLVILYVALRMIYEGADEVLGGGLPPVPLLGAD